MVKETFMDRLVESAFAIIIITIAFWIEHVESFEIAALYLLGMIFFILVRIDSTLFWKS